MAQTTPVRAPADLLIDRTIFRCGQTDPLPAFDVATNLKLAQEEWADNKALCAYCQAASIISMVSLVLALPEASRGLRALRR